MRKNSQEENQTLQTFATEFKWCWICGDKAEQIHHIFGRNWSDNKHHRCNLFRVCDRCHDDIIPLMDISAVCAIKAWMDQDHWDLKLAKEFSRRKNGRTGL